MRPSLFDKYPWFPYSLQDELKITKNMWINRTFSYGPIKGLCPYTIYIWAYWAIGIRFWAITRPFLTNFNEILYSTLEYHYLSIGHQKSWLQTALLIYKMQILIFWVATDTVAPETEKSISALSIPRCDEENLYIGFSCQLT